MSVVFLTCKKATELVEKRVINKLSPIQFIQLKLHLALCDACIVYEKFSKKMDNILAVMLKNKRITDAQPNEELKQKIKNKIESL